MITYEDFKKLDIIIGEIISAEKIENSDKLIKLEIDIGSKKIQVVAGIATSYSPKEFIGKQVPVLINLEPRKLMGIESQGMILAADLDGKPILLHPEKKVTNGSSIK